MTENDAEEAEELVGGLPAIGAAQCEVSSAITIEATLIRHRSGRSITINQEIHQANAALHSLQSEVDVLERKAGKQESSPAPADANPSIAMWVIDASKPVSSTAEVYAPIERSRCRKNVPKSV